MGSNFITITITMKQWDSPIGLSEFQPHDFRMIFKQIIFSRVITENPFVSPYTLMAEYLGYLVQIADHPTTVFILSVIGYPKEYGRAGDIGCKGESPTGNRTVIPLALLMSKALDQYMSFRCFRLKMLIMIGVISFPEMP
jgi:hypothetical protein